MEQINLFDSEEIEIPKHVKAPFECNKKLGSQEFVGNQRLFGLYVKKIQREYGCTFLEARKKFFELRDQ